MFEEFSKNMKEDEYLSEFRQKVAHQQQEEMENRRRELERSRNGFIGTLAGVVLAGLVSWFLLLPHFGFFEKKEIPVIRRPVVPVKIQPSEPGGMEILNQDKSVYTLVEKQEIVTPKVESLLPEPEKPEMPTIVAAPVEEEAPAEEEIDVEAEEEPAAIPAVNAVAEAVETSATKKLEIPEKPENIDVVVKTVEEKPAEQKPVEVKVEEKPMEVKPVEVKSAEAPKQKAEKGVWQVQLMASSNKEALEKGWKDLSGKYKALSGVPYFIEEPTSDKMFRLKAGAFENKSAAETLCNSIKSAGGSCLIKQK